MTNPLTSDSNASYQLACHFMNDRDTLNQRWNRYPTDTIDYIIQKNDLLTSQPRASRCEYLSHQFKMWSSGSYCQNYTRAMHKIESLSLALIQELSELDELATDPYQKQADFHSSLREKMPLLRQCRILQSFDKGTISILEANLQKIEKTIYPLTQKPEVVIKVNSLGSALKFAQSTLFCTHGSYDVLGLPIKFCDDPEDKNKNNKSDRISLAERRLITVVLRHPHTLIHELGHFGATRLVDPGCTSRIEVRTNGSGIQIPTNRTTPSNMSLSFIFASGPILSMAVSGINLFALSTFKNIMPLPLPIALPIGVILVISEAINMAQELFYAVDSAYQKDDGDFGMIRANGATHLCVSGAVLSAVFLAGSIGLTMVFRNMRN